MPGKVAISGLGRIGRAALKLAEAKRLPRGGDR
jgi:glyceraldehyde-3-phosphate dehydrogenase/erythrose-4-phosphate dehydrogenase